MVDPHIEEEVPVPSDRMLRQFAVLWLLFLFGLATWIGVSHDRIVIASVLAAVGALVGALGLVSPRAVAPLFSGLVTITSPIGWAISNAILLLLFYGMFTPLALLFRLLGRDALRRRRRPDRASLWIDRPPVTDVRRYFRQS